MTYHSVEELPLVLRVEDLMPILGIGRNAAYALARSDKLRTLRIGNQIRIPREALIDFISGTVA